MPDLSHEATDDGFHEIQLNGKQLVFLFIVTTVVSVAIFLCGVLVGRGARAARGEESPPIVAEATPASQPVADGGPPAAEPPAPATESPDELSYSKRLQGAAAPAEGLKTPTPAPAPVTAPPVAAAPPPPSSARAAPVADVPSAGRPGTWVVQVQALRDRTVAAALVTRLTGQGYPAFLVSPAPDSAPQFYKVHVGRYADRREAEQVKRRLEKEEQFKPWISR